MDYAFSFLLDNFISPMILLMLILCILMSLSGGNTSYIIKSGMDLIANFISIIFKLSFNMLVYVWGIVFKIIELKYPKLCNILVDDNIKTKRK